MLLRQIAQAGQLPAGFLARTLQKLRRHSLVASHRGAVRGYTLARPAQEIRLREIFEAIEGPAVFRRCIFSPRLAGDHHPCPLHHEWARVSATLQAVMDGTTLAQVAARGPTRG